MRAALPAAIEAAVSDQLDASERSKRIKRAPEVEVAIRVRIRTLRAAADLSQSALGSAIGISYQRLHNYELGRNPVAASTLQSIAAALGIHPGAFFDESLPTPIGPRPNLKAVVKMGQRIQRVGDPAIIHRLLTLADSLVASDGQRLDGADEQVL